MSLYTEVKSLDQGLSATQRCSGGGGGGGGGEGSGWRGGEARGGEN